MCTVTLFRAEQKPEKGRRWADPRGRWWLVESGGMWKLSFLPRGWEAQGLHLEELVAYAEEKLQVQLQVHQEEILAGPAEGWRWRVEPGDQVVAFGKLAVVAEVHSRHGSGRYPVRVRYLSGAEGIPFADELELACPDHGDPVDEDGVCPSCLQDAR